MSKKPMTLARVRKYLALHENNPKPPPEYEAVKWLLDGLDDAARIIASQDVEIQCVYRVLEQVRSITNLNIVTHGASLIFKDALQQIWKEQRHQVDEAIMEAQKQRIAEQKGATCT